MSQKTSPFLFRTSYFPFHFVLPTSIFALRRRRPPFALRSSHFLLRARRTRRSHCRPGRGNAKRLARRGNTQIANQSLGRGPVRS